MTANEETVASGEIDSRSAQAAEALTRQTGDDDRHQPPLMMEVGGASRAPRSRSEEHTSELQPLMRISYAVFCLKKKNHKTKPTTVAYKVENSSDETTNRQQHKTEM